MTEPRLTITLPLRHWRTIAAAVAQHEEAADAAAPIIRTISQWPAPTGALLPGEQANPTTSHS